MQITGKDEFHCALNPTAMPPCVLSQTHRGKTAFYALDPLQGKGKPLAEAPYAPGTDANLWSVSPDGSQIALLHADQAGTRIVVIATSDGSSKQVLVDSDAGRPQSISWFADGKSFYMSSLGTDSFDLLYVTMAGKAHALWRTNRNSGLLIRCRLPTESTWPSQRSRGTATSGSLTTSNKRPTGCP